MNIYIDSEKLIDMIEVLNSLVSYESGDRHDEGLHDAYKAVKNIITSLQQENQQEVDLEKRIDISIRQLYGVHSLEENNERWYKGRYENIKELVLQYYELGLNARKN